jgi:porin
MLSGEGDHSFEYSAKTDVLFNADFGKLGLWKGFSMTVHAEYNFGNNANFRGSALLPVNTALMFPGVEGADTVLQPRWEFGWQPRR